MIGNQSNKAFLNLLINSGVSNFTKNQPNNFYINENKIEQIEKIDLINVKTLEQLEKFINNSNSCSLKKTAKKTVFNDGNVNSKLMIIGEAPGKDEDIAGKPFVGQAGKLLNKMLQAIKINREDIYITNVIPWRPPNNRAPTNDEILQCLPFLQKHIEIINPDLIYLLGGTAAKAVLASNISISNLRKKLHLYNSINLNKKITTIVSYHPAFLLRSPQYKKEAWEDLKKLKIEIENAKI